MKYQVIIHVWSLLINIYQPSIISSSSTFISPTNLLPGHLRTLVVGDNLHSAVLVDPHLESHCFWDKRKGLTSCWPMGVEVPNELRTASIQDRKTREQTAHDHDSWLMMLRWLYGWPPLNCRPGWCNYSTCFQAFERLHSSSSPKHLKTPKASLPGWRFQFIATKQPSKKWKSLRITILN